MTTATSNSWFGRNWKWLLALILGLVLAVILIVAGLIMLLLSSLRGSTPATMAMSELRQAPAVVSVTGRPIELDWAVTGNINTGTSSGQASLSLPISGPNGSGTALLDASHGPGAPWQLNSLEFVPNSGRRVQILP